MQPERDDEGCVRDEGRRRSNSSWSRSTAWTAAGSSSADPAGAVLAAWQPGEHHSAEIVNEPGAWSWAQLFTNDLEELEGVFYVSVFGWETDTFGVGPNAPTMWRVPG